MTLSISHSNWQGPNHHRFPGNSLQGDHQKFHNLPKAHYTIVLNTMEPHFSPKNTIPPDLQQLPPSPPPLVAGRHCTLHHRSMIAPTTQNQQMEADIHSHSFVFVAAIFSMATRYTPIFSSKFCPVTFLKKWDIRYTRWKVQSWFREQSINVSNCHNIIMAYRFPNCQSKLHRMPQFEQSVKTFRPNSTTMQYDPRIYH